MPEKPLFTQATLRELIDRGEGQFLELKGLWDFEVDPPRPLAKRKVRELVAEYVAAFANADGGILVLGVDDDGVVGGHGYAEEVVGDFLMVPERQLRPAQRVDHQVLDFEGHSVIIFAIGRAPTALMVEGDGYPYRVGDQAVAESEVRINRIKNDYAERGVEQRFADDASLEDLDLDLLPASIADADRESWLETRGLVLPRYGSPAVTRAGVLLLGRPPIVRWHPNLSLRVFGVSGVERLHGAERNVRQLERLELPVASMIPVAYEVVQRHIRRSERLHNLFFRETPEYPTFAWQEAVVNAVAHRDYRDTGRGIEVWFYDDRMEVRSPGSLVDPVTLTSLRNRDAVHASRNPIISRALVEFGVMREEGEGIPRMFEEMERSLLHPPAFALVDDTFVVTLRNEPIFESGDESWNRLIDRLSVSLPQKRVLVAHPDGFTNEQFRLLNGVDRDEAYRQIQEMVSAGVVAAASSPGRGAVYRLSSDLLTTRAWLGQRLPTIRRHFEDHEALANADYRRLFGVSRQVALQELRRLVEEDYLVLVGERRGARYLPAAGLQGI